MEIGERSSSQIKQGKESGWILFWVTANIQGCKQKITCDLSLSYSHLYIPYYSTCFYYNTFLTEQMDILIAPKFMLLNVIFLLDSSLIFSNASWHFQLTIQFFFKLNTTNSSSHSNFSVFIGNTNFFLVFLVRNFRVLWFFWCWGFPLLYYNDSNPGSDFPHLIPGNMQQTFT